MFTSGCGGTGVQPTRVQPSQDALFVIKLQSLSILIPVQDQEAWIERGSNTSYVGPLALPGAHSFDFIYMGWQGLTFKKAMPWL